MNFNSPLFSMVKSGAAGLVLAVSTQTGCALATDSSWQVVEGSQDIAGKGAVAIELSGQEHWLLSSMNQGLILVDPEGKTKQRLDGAFELLDLRHDIAVNNQQLSIALTLDYERNRLIMAGLTPRSGELEQLAELPKPSYNIDGLCLYQGHQGHLYAFVLDGRSVGEQWLLIDGTKGNVAPTLIRSLNMPPNSSFCSVDDTSHTLYVSEENLGVWAYGAQPESGRERHLVQVVKPHGSAESVAGLSAYAGGMITVDTKAGQLNRFDASGETFTLNDVLPLNGLGEAETLSLKTGKYGVWATVFDDATDRSFKKQLSIKVAEPQAEKPVIVLPEVETPPMTRSGDVADDPAIWVNSQDPALSLILGTNKKAGLHIYDISGEELQTFDTGRLNNVDVRSGFTYQGQTIDLAAASNRTEDSISLFGIDPATARLSSLGSVPTRLKEVYGLCMYKDAQEQMFVFINNKDGLYHQYLIQADGDQLTSSLVREFSVASQPEGCVAIDDTQQLFVGEEGEGVWLIGADAASGTKLEAVLKVGGKVQADVEGLAFYKGKDHSYIVVSSQGNDSYAVIDAQPPFALRGVFKVGLNVHGGIDGASETDGLDVTSADLGGIFSEGMLVVQDGRNVMPSSAQNFKYIPWSAIREALKLP